MSRAMALVALSLLPVWRWRAVAQQLASGADASDVLRAQCDERRERAPGTPSAERLLERAGAACRRGDDCGLRRVLHGEPDYPDSLTTLIDPPPVLWLRGHPAALARPAVAVVGARAGSPYALAVAERLAAELAERGLAVTSGLARGVDAAAHRGALSVNGVTVGVLGCGADIVYPHEHRDLAEKIGVRGAVVSEFAPGTEPRPEFFPQRNRIISGLSRAVVVVEAGEKSGSLITARCALEQGRDVLAVPGNILNGRNRGCHALLRDGARLVDSVDDILEELGMGAGSEGECTELPTPDDPVLATLAPGESCDLDRISGICGLPTGAILTRLFELELAGRVRKLPGGQFMRIDRSC